MYLHESKWSKTIDPLNKREKKKRKVNKDGYKFFYKPLGTVSLDFGSSLVGWLEASSSTFISLELVWRRELSTAMRS